MPDRIFRAAVYLRLSREDMRGGRMKDESNSITNQRKLIEAYLEEHPDIRLEAEMVDDGQSGVSFERPGFQAMLSCLSEGRADCVIVKDLSRFGRNYIDAGYYIERVFPREGIRFIAVLDRYDSLHKNGGDRILVPFKNLINDAYAREGSINVRNILAVKRKQGEFVNAFTKYGFCKDEDNPHEVRVDPCAAETVRRIAVWILEGLCPARAAQRLNGLGIPSPYEYKKSAGCRYQTSFQTKRKAEWSTQAVLRVVSDPAYNGCLILGKTTTPNHKVKKRTTVPEEEQIKIADGLPKIINDADYRTLQRALCMDTRLAPGQTEIWNFSGIVRCAVCGQPMIRKKYVRKGKEYRYLVCSVNRRNKEDCPGRTIREEFVDEAALFALSMQALIFAPTPASAVRDIPEDFFKLCEEKKGEERRALQRLLPSLYQDYREGMFTREEYQELKEEFEVRIQRTELERKRLLQERERNREKEIGKQKWAAELTEGKVVDRLTRAAILRFFDRITVYGRDEIKIEFRFGGRPCRERAEG